MKAPRDIPKYPAVETFASGLDHPEGLAFAPDGSLWAGGEAGQVYRVSPDGRTVTLAAEVGGFCLGFALGPDGRFYICNHKLPAIVRVDPATRRHEIFADRADRRKLHVPNAGVFDRHGFLYASNSGDWGARTGGVYRFTPEGRGTVVATRVAFANGVALTPDGAELLVVQSTEDNILSFPVRAGGKLGRPTVFAENLRHVPDGIAFDARGNLYVACYGGHNAIYVIDASRRVRLLVEDPQGILLNRPTNVAPSPDGRWLYVANLGGQHLSRIRLR